MCNTGCLKNQKNVILVIKDAMRKDRLSCYGGKVNTPNIDMLGNIGTIMNWCEAVAPSTSMSIAGIARARSPFKINKHYLKNYVSHLNQPRGLRSIGKNKLNQSIDLNVNRNEFNKKEKFIVLHFKRYIKFFK